MPTRIPPWRTGLRGRRLPGIAMTFDGETLFEGLKTFLVWVGVVVLVIAGVIWTYMRERKP
jgi:hypothetical protein